MSDNQDNTKYMPWNPSSGVTLREEADRIVQRLEDVDKGREVPPDYLEPVFPTIPDEFWDKVGVQKKKKGTEKRKRAVKKEA